MSDVNKILDEQIRVLKTGGTYVIVTLAQDHIVTRLRERFRTGFSANVHWIPTRSPLSTFLFAFRKLENTKATTTYKIYFASDAQTSASNHVIRSLLSSNKHVLTVDNPTSYITNLQHATYSYRILGEHGEGVRFDTSLTPVSRDDLDESEQANVREFRKRYDKATKLSADFVSTFAQARSEALVAWQKARKDSDFSAFLPHLHQLFDNHNN